MVAPSKNRSVSAAAAAAASTSSMWEVRLESASTTVFSEPCSFCGNRKRRCLNPITRSRKKRLVFEAASALCPPSSPLLRPESSPLPSSSHGAGLLLTPPLPKGPFGRTVDPVPPLPSSSRGASLLPTPLLPKGPFGRTVDPVPPLPSSSRGAGLLLTPSLPKRPFGRTVDPVPPPSSSVPPPSFSVPPASPPPFLVPAPPDRFLKRSNFGKINQEVPKFDKHEVEWLNETTEVRANCSCAAVHELTILLMKWLNEMRKVRANCSCTAVHELEILLRFKGFIH